MTGQSTDYSDQYVTYDQGNKKLTITVPYYYLEEPGDDSSYAGGTLHQNDQIGTLTYVWQADDTGGNTLSDNNAFKKFTTEKTADVKYHLTVTYAADAFSKASQYDNNGSDRTRTLTSQTNADNSTILIRDPVGTEQTGGNATGTALIHDVDGRIKIEKKVNQEKLLSYLSSIGDGSLTLTFDLNRTYDGSTTKYKTLTLTLDAGSVSGIRALTADSDGNVIIKSEWVTGLPIGEYTVSETISDENVMYLKSLKGKAVTDDPDTGFEETADLAAAFDPAEGNVTWYIGEVHSGTPGQSSYADSDFKDETIAADYNGVKKVDPDKSADGGKYYLNAQIGQAEILNELLTGGFKIEKTGFDDVPLAGVTFTLYPADQNWTQQTPAIKTVTTALNDDQTKALARFDSLSIGKYILVEEKTAKGYALPGAPWKVEIKKDASGNKKTTVTLTPFEDNGAITKDVSSDEEYIFRIHNNKIYELPSAGGAGTYLFTIIGIAILTMAFLGFRSSGRKEGNEEKQ